MNELNKKTGKPTFAFAALLRKNFLQLVGLVWAHTAIDLQNCRMAVEEKFAFLQSAFARTGL